jgi:hypothetical protein
VPNSKELKAGVKSLLAAFRKLRQSTFWKRQVSGGAAVIEIKGSEGHWHCHIHAVIFSPFIPVRQISKHWKRHSGGFIVWIKLIPLGAVVGYLTKYLAKSSVDEIYMMQVSDALKGVRMFIPFGSWYAGLKVLPKPHCICKRCKGTVWMCIDFGTFKVIDDPPPTPALPPPAPALPMPSYFTFARQRSR